VNGPLNFDVSSQSYDTTVKTPSGGWDSQLASSGGSPISSGPEWPQLFSQFAFSNVNDQGKLTMGFVTVTSKAAFMGESGKIGIVSYTIRNESAEPASVFINLPISKDRFSEVSFARHFVVIPPKESLESELKLTQDIRAVPATIVIENAMGRPTLTDLVGVYAVSDGVKARLDPDLWDGQ